MSAVAAAAIVSLGKGALVAAVVAALGWAWRADARVQSGLATVGLWVVAAWFLADVWVGLSHALPASGGGTWRSGGAMLTPRTFAGAGLSHWLSSSGGAPPWLGWLWGAGVLGGCARTIVGVSIVHRWRALALPIPEAVAAVQRWRGVARALGLGVVPRFAVSRQIVSPMVVGVFAPLVLIPAAAIGGQAPALSAAHLDALIAHELAHLARADPWVAALQRAIEVALFHNPAVWWLGRRARRFREAACDDLAIDAGAPRMTYAHALLALAQLEGYRATALACPPALGASDGSLTARIARLFAPPARARPARAAWVAIACVAALAIAGLGLRPQLETSRTEPTADRLQIAWLPAAVRQHEASIVAAALRHGVDPDLVAIVTLVESGGNAQARSSLGAAGLMQLMPSTAAAAAGDQGLPPPTAERLTDPAYNVELGTTVLAQHLATFAGDDPHDPDAIARAAAAYNAGPQRVRAWLERGVPLPEETRRYQAKVAALWARRAEPTR